MTNLVKEQSVYTLKHRPSSQFAELQMRVPCSVPIQHWQLRDLIKACPGGFVFYNGSNLMQYNLEEKRTKVVCSDFGFSPTSFDYFEDNYVLVGQKGQILTVNENKETHLIATTNTSINNAVHIHRFNDELITGIANNEGLVRFYKNKTNELVDVYRLKDAVNNYEIAPNHKTMITVGDTNEANVFALNESGFVLSSQLKMGPDNSAFKISFNSTSKLALIGTQSACAYIFDINSGKKVACLLAKQYNSHKGAIRSVEFSQRDCIDMLLYAEHSTYVNLVDSRAFNKKQSMFYGEHQGDKNLSGACFSFDSKGLFVATEMETFVCRLDWEKRRMRSSGQII